MSPKTAMPSQKALKLPATRPERISREAPPSRGGVTTSSQCLDLELVKILTNSGMTASASVPQLMMTESFHHRPLGRAPSCHLLAAKVTAMETSDVIQTNVVRGCSKSIFSFPPCVARVRAPLIQ